MLVLIGILAFTATMLGGLFALRFVDKLHLVLGFSAGAVAGVAFFDLIPEAFELGIKSYDTGVIAGTVACGFFAYLLLDRIALANHHVETSLRGVFGGGSLVLHSMLDGLGIGLAFQVSNQVGFVVTLAVLCHDFSDGINTVNVVYRGCGKSKLTLRWLIADAIAPCVGIAIASLFTVPEGQLGILLALFSGFFLYLGASDLIPESYHNHPVKWTTFMTLLGMAVIFLVTNVI